MAAAICFLVVFVVCFCIYLFVFNNSGFYLWLLDIGFLFQEYEKQASSRWLIICVLRLYLKQLIYKTLSWAPADR